MELLLASAVGILTASGVYLVLRQRTFPVIVGLSLLSYAVNVFLFATGRLIVNQPPILQKGVTEYTDPLPQALVIVMIALSAYLSDEDDTVDLADSEEDSAS